MSLSGLLTAYAELIGDVLVNDCGQSAPRILRHHAHNVPDDLECTGSVLSVWWESPLEPRSAGARIPCPGPPVVTLAARYAVCWKLADADVDGIELFDSTWDTDAAVLADVAECVARSLFRLTCDGPYLDKAVAFRELVVTGALGGVEYVGTEATLTSDSAGIEWRVKVSIRQVEEPS